MSTTLTPAWGINTVTIGSVRVITAKLSFGSYFVPNHLLDALIERPGIRISKRNRQSTCKKTGMLRFTPMTTILFTGVDCHETQVTLEKLLDFRHAVAMNRVHNKYRPHEYAEERNREETDVYFGVEEPELPF